ncbi:GNAT family N-acetyltransferase [Psychrilyobacter atlanticus]|uniref:GNAT family N-acetyltransferase n=1 Tax=Psychrilyobacter atlanticus TaxID=271091 RepID=UPI000424D8DF|nr:GNAT family N-acetyltransferase [Psychrilyobacter atlanticus]
MIYELEPMIVEDAKNLHEFFNQIARETNFVTFEEFESPSEKVCKSIIESAKEAPNYAYCIKKDGKIITSLIATTRNGRLRERHKSNFGIAVSKKHWGKGIGSLLIEKVIDESKKNSISKITLKVNEKNTRAIKLYKKYGFEIEGIYKKDRLVNGVMETGISMALFL